MPPTMRGTISYVSPATSPGIPEEGENRLELLCGIFGLCGDGIRVM